MGKDNWRNLGVDTREFDIRLKTDIERAEAVLSRFLPEEAGCQAKLMEAMNYSLTAGGKRLRPILMWETYQMCGGEKDEAIECFMAAIEMIHTYSLVHDDLPAMDNDRYRRGRETTWCVYGDAMGILAGDALLNFAFETALSAMDCYFRKTAQETSKEEVLSGARRISSALSVLARKAGAWGMIGGQAVDVMAEKTQSLISQEELMFIHEHKTAALIQAAMMVGAILAGASESQVAAIEKCAYNIGIAFQIQDDILDVTGDSEELGKPIGSDAQNNKQTYVTLNGLERSRAQVEALSREAVAILEDFGGEHEFLKELILTLIHRRK